MGAALTDDGASTIPATGFITRTALVEKSAVMDFSDWYGSPRRTPLGGLIAGVGGGGRIRPERRLSGLNSRNRRWPATLQKGSHWSPRSGRYWIFLLLDGVLIVVIDDVEVAEVGPGAIVVSNGPWIRFRTRLCELPHLPGGCDSEWQLDHSTWRTGLVVDAGPTSPLTSP